MPPQRDPISVRATRLNNLILGKGSGLIQKPASSSSHRRSIIPVANATSPVVAEAMCRESLLDAFCLLYNECDKEALKKRDRYIAEFVHKYRPIVEETRQLRVNVDDFAVKTLIGKGYFGNVHLVVERQTNDVYAMKRIKKSVVTTSQVKEERDIMSRRSSEWITNLQYAFQDNDHLYLIMEYLPGGDLLSLMTRHGPFDEDMARFYLAELTLALHSLHIMGYVHRDIKPENILIDRFGHIKLADFGNAAALDRDGHVLSLSPVGTPDYIAPELLQTISTYKLSKSMHDVSCDYWSMGIIGYELICEITPFHEENVHETYSKILSHCEDSHLKELITFPSDLKVSSNYKNLIESLVTNPTKRLTYEKITQHPFFASIKWATLRSKVPPPIIPTVKSDDDTSNFEDSSRHKGRHPNAAKKSLTADMKSNDFSGKDLPFIGYSFVHLEKQLLVDEIHADETRLAKMTEKMKELQSKLKARTDEIGKLKQELMRAEEVAKQSSSKSKVLQDAKEEIKKLQNIIKEKTMELAACKTQIKTLQSSAKIEEEMWEKKEATITDLLRLNRQKYEEAKITSEQRYEKLLAEKKNELASIVQKLDSREVELSAKVEECKHLADKMANYKEMLRQFKEQSQVDQANFENNKLQITETYESKLSDLRSKLRQEKDKQSRLTTELNDVRSELNESISSSKSTQEVRHAIEKNNGEILKRLNSEIEANNKLHAVNSDLEQKLSQAQQANHDLQQEVSRLERDLQLAECTRNLAESSLSVQESPYETAQGSLTELHIVEEQLRADLEAAKVNENVQKVRADQLQTLVGKLEEMLERFNEHSLSPTKPCPAPRNGNGGNSAVGDMLERKNEKLEDKLAAVREQMIVERQAARTANLSLWKVEKRLEEAMSDKKMVERRMQLTEERIKKVQEERDEAQRTLKSAQQETKQREERIEELKKELANAKSDMLKEHRMWEKSEQERMKCKSEIIEHLANVHKLEERLSELRLKLHQTQQRCDGLSLENKRLIRELNEERDCNASAADSASAALLELKNLKDNYERLKYACTVTDSQLTEVEGMLEAEQKRNKTQQEHIDKLYTNVRERDEKITQLKKELHETQSEKKLSETRIKALTADMEELKLNLQDVQKKFIAQQQQLVENTNDLYSTQERVEVLNNDASNLQTLNKDYERELLNLREENSRILSELYHSKEEVQALQIEIKEKLSCIDDLNAEIDELQETLTEKENHYVQREIKSEATLAQHKKLIDYLQLKVEDLSHKKKKTLADKIFGSGNSKENISPVDVESSILYRTLKEELRREKQHCKTLQEQIDQLNGDSNAVTMRSPLKAHNKNDTKSDEPPQRPMSMVATTNTHTRSPRKQTTLKRATSELIEKNKTTVSKSNYIQQHRFELALQESKMDVINCIACAKAILAGSPYWKCKECKAKVHRKCRSEVNSDCDGIAAIMAKPAALAQDSDSDSLSLEKFSGALDTVDSEENNTEKANKNDISDDYIGTLVYNVAAPDSVALDTLEINCAYEIMEQQILLLGCNTGLYTFHAQGQRLMHIAGIDSVSYIAISERLAKAIMVGSNGEKLYQCDFRQLQTRCQSVTASNKAPLETYVIDLPFANRTASEKWKLVQISNETENALDSVAIAATSTRIVILKYELKLQKFKPVRALDTATAVTAIHYTRHSAIVSSDKFYEIDLDNYGAEEFVDLSDKTLTHTNTCQPYVAVRISRQEFLLCFAECGVFVDEFGCRSRPYDLNWVYAPTGFMYREPFLYISHYQSVQILRLHRSYTKELASITSEKNGDSAAPEFQRVYLSHYMPTLLAHSGDTNIYTLAIQKQHTRQQIYQLDAMQAFKQKLNISMETISSVGTSVTLGSAITTESI